MAAAAPARASTPDYFHGSSATGRWAWIFFGDRMVDRVLYVVQQEPDDVPDSFGFLGHTEAGLAAEDGMVVFGFGRREATPFLTMPHTFHLGFSEQAVRDAASYDRLRNALTILLAP